MSEIDSRLTQHYLRERFYYNLATGIFTCKAGGTPGCKNGCGYWQISVFNKKHLAHRLAWLYVTGEWPAQNIDHIDGNRANNAWANLRDASQSMNRQNLKAPLKNNKTGFLGVTRYGSRFAAYIYDGKRNITLGRFATAEAAHAAYLVRKRVIHSGNTL